VARSHEGTLEDYRNALGAPADGELNLSTPEAATGNGVEVTSHPSAEMAKAGASTTDGADLLLDRLDGDVGGTVGGGGGGVGVAPAGTISAIEGQR